MPLARDTVGLTLLLQRVLAEAGTWCHTSTTQDYKTVLGRVEHEGLSFLTIALPAFCQDFERCLDAQKVDSDAFLGFSRKGGLPKFLSGFLCRVFDPKSGVLLDAPDHNAILAVRQITRLFGKILIDCSDERIKRAMDRYVECERDVTESDISLSDSSLREDFQRVGSLLWASVLSRVDRKVYDGEVRPKHGPGATADYLRGNAKWNQSDWTERLEEVFHAVDFLLPSVRHHQSLDRVTWREPGSEVPVRVIPVPKTLKTPRIIAIEPTCMQYMQQGILELICEAVYDDKLVGPLIAFNDQAPNQRLAAVGSRDGSLATLDLSEASDRVSNLHVRDLLARHPHVAAAVDATRSRKAVVQGHGEITLAKFASMGSALCFPFEAMVFTTVVFLAVEQELNTRLTRKHVESLQGRVRIYGDDIIVPVELVDRVVSLLEAFGFRVNTGKSFWNGKFRESCGKEYFDGTDVTAVKCRRLLPTQRMHVQEIIAAVNLRNQFYWAGWWQTARYMDQLIGPLLKGFYPTVDPQSPVLGAHSVLGYATEEMCPTLHRPLVKGWVVRNQLPNDPLEGLGALLKVFLKRGDEPFALEHLERAGRPRAVGIKLRKATPF